MRAYYFRFWYLLISLLVLAFGSRFALAQGSSIHIPAPDRKHIFQQDNSKVKKKEKARRAAVLKVTRPGTQDLDFKANDVQFNKETNEIQGKGDVLISRAGVQVQAQEGKVNLTTKDAEVKGGMVLSGETGSLSADSAKINMDSGLGEFENASFALESEQFFFRAGRAQRLSELQYQLVDSAFTTCDCEADLIPWEVRSSEARITRDGYAHTYDTTLRLFDTPVMYMPWFAFPVKEERQSGLLIPNYSYSDRDGFGFKQPVFLVLDDSTDATLSPFVETRTRAGSAVDFRQTYSKRSKIFGRLVYSDETLRDGDLRGTVTDGIFDPTFEENRLGGFFRQSWRSDASESLPMSLYSDVNLVGDSLFLRELEDFSIGERESRYTTSTSLFRVSPAEWLSAEVSAEYNQSLLTDQDLTFQRIPEVSISASRSLHPFGYNSLGLKAVPSIRLTGTEFSRERGYDGKRFDVYPGVRIPFHYQNYFASTATLGLRNTSYQLDNRENPAGGALLDESPSRTVFDFGYQIGTAFERVFDLPEHNTLTWLSGLGASNQSEKLVRVRHNIEPTLRYYYTPPEDQGDLPLFDALDRIRPRNVMVYGVRTSLDGRFVPVSGTGGGKGLEELTPRLEDLPLLSTMDALSDAGDAPGMGAGSLFSMRRGSVSELGYVSVKQAYDFREANLDLDPSRGPASDLGFELGTSPSRNFAMRLETNYDMSNGGFSSWALAKSFYDDRGDAFRGRFTFVDNSISQVEGNIELSLTSRLSAGYYGRWDEREREFIENRGALRLASLYDCWFFDIGVASKLNPDRKMMFLSFTFGGLGTLTQNIGMSEGR